MINKLLQSIANGIIKRLEKAGDDDDLFTFYLELGMWFDMFCINYFDLYLE